jgi:mannose-1-phosphate guanylyltransferase/phosphomannomutase
VADAVRGSGVTIRRTPASSAALMAAATADDVVFAARSTGEYVFPELSAAPDALATTVRVLALLLDADRPLSGLRRTLPASTLVSGDLPCPWSAKGTAMRMLIEYAKAFETDDLDGLRIYDDGGWVQVLPDADLPVFHLFAEAATREESTALEQKYRGVLERIVAEHVAHA